MAYPGTDRIPDQGCVCLDIIILCVHLFVFRPVVLLAATHISVYNHLDIFNYFGILNHLLIIQIINSISLCADEMNLLTFATISHEATGTCQDVPGFCLCCWSNHISHNPHNRATSNNLKGYNSMPIMNNESVFQSVFCNVADNRVKNK